MEIDIKSLKDSNEFLNYLYDNVISAIFIADSEPRIYNFNDSFKTLFYKEDDQILKELCGNAIGCMFVVEEGRDCGSTSNCDDCILRKSIVKSFTEKVPVFKEKLERKFYINNKPVKKCFIFSTRIIEYNNSEMILVIVDDITELENQKKRVVDYSENLKKLLQNATMEMVRTSKNVAASKIEKDTLLNELYHRMGNSLQLISSLINLQGMHFSDDCVLKIFRNINFRIQAIKLIYDYMLHTGSLNEIDLKEYLQSISIIPNTFFNDKHMSINLVLPQEEVVFPLSTAMPIGLFINEAMLCILEHSESSRNGNTCDISFSQNNDACHISMALHRDSPETVAPSTSDPLNFELMQVLANQIGGSLICDMASNVNIELRF